jgi:hypothetical protein
VDGFGRVVGVADEDLEREEDGKTAAVHFLRFELDAPMRAALKGGAGLGAGIDHPNYRASAAVEAAVRRSLAGDLV